MHSQNLSHGRQLPPLSNGSTLNEKNLFELKNARRVYVEGSVFSNHWDALRSQYYAITLKSAADSPGSGQGSAWSVSEEVVLENNRISHINGGVAVVRDFFYPGRVYDPLKPQHIRIINTLFDDLTAGRWGANRTWTFFMGGVDDLLVDHVSVIDTIESPTDSPELLLYINSINSYRPEITDSILPLNNYGIRNTCGEGLTALNVGTSGWFDPSTFGSCGAATGANAGTWKITGNILPKLRSYHNPDRYPTNNAYPDNYEGIGMNGYRTCGTSAAADPCESPIVNYALRPDSAFKRQASDGADPGIDSIVLNDRIQCTTLGDTRGCLSGGQIVPPTTPTPTPTPTPSPIPSPTPTPVATPTPTPIPTPSPSPTPTPSNIGAFPGPNPVSLPGTIEAENFDRGGEGIGYHELFGSTGSSIYRNLPVETVSIQSRTTASGGYAVFEAAAGEWLNYTVDIPVGGYFSIGFKYASEFYGGTFHLELDGQDITGPVTVESTGSWATYQTIYRRTRVGMGRHKLRVVMDTNSINPQTLSVSPVVCNLDAIVFATVRKT
ncbi:MAG: carbohydrate-binding protein [Pyrinomonadaceae bacterium]